MEEIAGPVFGFYLACYTVEGRDGHYGYAKLYERRPSSVWETRPAIRKVAAGPYTDAATALRGVIARSERKLARREARRSDWALLEVSRPGELA